MIPKTKILEWLNSVAEWIVANNDPRLAYLHNKEGIYLIPAVIYGAVALEYLILILKNKAKLRVIDWVAFANVMIYFLVIMVYIHENEQSNKVINGTNLLWLIGLVVNALYFAIKPFLIRK